MTATMRTGVGSFLLMIYVLKLGAQPLRLALGLRQFRAQALLRCLLLARLARPARRRDQPTQRLVGDRPANALAHITVKVVIELRPFRIQL